MKCISAFVDFGKLKPVLERQRQKLPLRNGLDCRSFSINIENEKCFSAGRPGV